MKKYFCLILFVLPFVIRAQHANVVISTIAAPNEPSIIISPKNPLNMVAGANLDNVYYSHDGGLTWTINTLSSSQGVWGDPVIGADTAGHFYFFHLSNPPTGNWIDRIVCQKSTDAGLSWSDGTFAGLNGTKAQDKHWVCVDPANNNLYLNWTQFDHYGTSAITDTSVILFSRSVDAGANWSQPIKISRTPGNCVDSDSTNEGAVPTVGPSGEIYVAWSGPAGIVFNRSFDQGLNWDNSEILISSHPGGWDQNIPGINRCNGMPVTACDLSNGPHRGDIYVNWTDQRNGEENTDVWLSKSTDQGSTWSSPVRVNDDNTGHQQFFTWMTIDQSTGYLWFVWYDRRNYPDLRTDVYMAVSKDGGTTFQNFRVSESPFVPQSSVFFGDYTNISAVNGIVRPVWGRLDGTSQSIMTAIVDTSAIIASDNSFQIQGEFEFYPNPAKEQLTISFKLHQPQVVEIEVFDLYGKSYGIVSSEMRSTGRNIFSLDLGEKRFAPGAYILRLKCREYSKQKKIILQ